MEMKMEMKITRINNKFHARLLSDTGEVLDEMACTLKADIGHICREMLRWQDKMGNTTEWTRSARERQQKSTPVGKILYIKR